MYDNRKYFVKDVLTRAKEDLYNEEGEIAQEVIYTPRNDKKLRGVEEGGNMILRPYDDYTRKRALMYEVVAVVDNWGSQNAKNLKDLKSELNAAIEGGDTAAEKRLTKAVDKLQSKLQKKATHRFDYVLNNPVSLYNAEEMNNIRAEESKDLRARKVC